MLFIRCETDSTTLSSKKIPTSFFVSFPMTLLNVPKFHMKPRLIASCFGARLLRPPAAHELIKAHCDYLSHFLTFLSNSADLFPTLASGQLTKATSCLWLRSLLFVLTFLGCYKLHAPPARKPTIF